MSDEKRAERRRKVRMGLLIILVAVGLILIFQNDEETSFHILLWSVKAPLALLVLIATGVGALAGLLAPRLMSRRGK